MAAEKQVIMTTMSNIDICFLAIYLCTIIITGFPPIAAQPGFLSIDCGSSEAYTDIATGIFWQTDANYISTGRNIDTGSDENPSIVNTNELSWNMTRQLGTVRYFDDPRPKHNRDCYILPTMPRKRYIIRPTFAVIENNPLAHTYSSSQFDLYLNSTFIRKFQIDYDSSRVFFPIQIIFQSRGNLISLCLVRNAGNSFITSLELRELKSGMYNKAGKTLDGKTIFLDNVASVAFGSNRPFYRYPDDAYDRFWYGYNSGSYDHFKNLSNVGNRSNILASTSVEAPDLPPVAVMQQAFVGYDSKLIKLKYNGPAGVIFATAYFQELDGNASDTNVRGMELLVNGVLVNRAFNSLNKVLELQGMLPYSSAISLNVSVRQTPWSRLPPMVNAAEIYSVGTLNLSQTAQEDVDVVSALKIRIPQLFEGKGDPCLPVPFSWLECSPGNLDPMTFRITGLFLDKVNISGSIPHEVFVLKGLSALSLSNTNLRGSIPDMTKLSLLHTLSLRNNNLRGNIHTLSSLRHLQKLYLENNSLTGSIPSYFSSFQNLTELHVDNNNFSGVVPASVKNKMGLSFTFTNNPALKLIGPSSGLSTGVTAGIIFGSLFALAIVVTVIWCLLTRRKRALAKILQEIHKAGLEGSASKVSPLQSVAGGHFGSLCVFTLREVSDATQKFSKKIGEGSFGSVFYGRLRDGREVAVKVKEEASRQGLPEFRNELELLSRIHHRNLVSLVGYCEGVQQILLYAYLSSGSLEGYLHGTKTNSKTPLSWKARLNIAVNSATGLEYLHFHCNPQIIHRDVKSANILLDGNMVAKVADFGISKQTFAEMTSGVNTAVKGTFGYMDPELFVTKRLTRNNDVYSFGIVLLEIISGCHPRPLRVRDGRSIALVEWLRNCVRDGNAFDVFDPAMDKKFSYQSARMLLDLALQCTNPVLSRRPDMRQVTRALAQAEQLEDLEQAEGHRGYRPGVGLDEVQNEEYTPGGYPSGVQNFMHNTHVTYDTTVVEAR